MGLFFNSNSKKTEERPQWSTSRGLMRFIKVRFSGRNSRIPGGQRGAHPLLAIIRVESPVRNSLLPNAIQLPWLESHISQDNQTLVLLRSSPLIRVFLLRKDLWHQPSINKRGYYRLMYSRTHKACSLRSNPSFILVTIQMYLPCLLQQTSTVVFVDLSNLVPTNVSKNQWPQIG